MPGIQSFLNKHYYPPAQFVYRTANRIPGIHGQYLNRDSARSRLLNTVCGYPSTEWRVLDFQTTGSFPGEFKQFIKSPLVASALVAKLATLLYVVT